MISKISHFYPRSRLAKTLSMAAVITSCFSATKPAAAQPVQSKTVVGINGEKIRNDRPIQHCGQEAFICGGILAERASINGKWHKADTEVFYSTNRKLLNGTLDEDVRILGHDFHAGEIVAWDDESGYPTNGKLSVQGFKILFPNISLSEGFDPKVTYLTAGYLSNLTPQMREQIKGIDLYPKSLVTFFVAKQECYADRILQKIYLSRNILQQKNIAHEAAHLLMYHLEYNPGDNFEGRWLDVAGDVYGKYTENKDGQTIWSEGNDNERGFPCHGCVMPYGCKNVSEDVATFVGEIYSNIGALKLLVDPSSPRHDWRYSAKINLLHEFGFITDNQYHTIIKPDQEQIGHQEHSFLYYIAKHPLSHTNTIFFLKMFIGIIASWGIFRAVKYLRMKLKNRGT